MSLPNPPKRKYDSTRRQARALESQAKIIYSARDLFVEKGYAGATIEAIARRARVSPETIYSVFSNKLTLFTRAVGLAVDTDGGPMPAMIRSYMGDLRSERDQHRQIQMFSSRMQLFFSQVAALVEVMRAAARTEPEIKLLLEKYLNDRHQGMGFFIDCLLINGPLRDGVDKTSALETIWVLASAEVYNLLVGHRGWLGEEYETWLSESLERLLLP